MAYKDLTRGKAHSTPNKLNGVYRGVISNIDGDGRLFVQIPRVTFSLVYGPLDFVETANGYEIGDNVAVESVEGYPDAFIVMGKIGP